MTRTWGDLVELRYGRALRDYDRTTLSPVTVYGTNGPIGATDTAISPGPGVIVGRKGAYRGVHYAANPFWVIDTAYFVDPRVEINLKWAYYALLGADINGLGSGSAIPSTTREDFSALPVLVPTRSEQDGIAEVLGAFDDKIAANRRVVDLAMELADALVLRAVEPSGTRPLSEIGRVTMGSSPKGVCLNETGDGMVFYQGVRDFGVRSPRPRVWSTDPVRTCGPDAILIAVRAPVGDVNLATEETCIGRGVAAVESSRPLTLFHTLRVFSSLWAPFDGTGTVFSSISGPELKALSVPTVVDSDADRLEDELRTVGSSAAASLCVVDALAKTRDELLPLLMSGKLTVQDAEKRAEEVL